MSQNNRNFTCLLKNGSHEKNHQEQAVQVPGVNGAGSKTEAEPAPRIGLLRCSGGAGLGPKMEPAPFMAEPAPSGC